MPCARAASTLSPVLSVLPSSTKICSNEYLPANAACISCASGRTFSSSLQTGMTTETSGIDAGDGWVVTVEGALPLWFVRPPPAGAVR